MVGTVCSAKTSLDPLFRFCVFSPGFCVICSYQCAPGLTLEGGFWVITALGWKVQTLRSAWGFPSACNGSWPMAGAGISKPCSLATSIQIQTINYTRVFFHQLLLEYVSSHNILFCPILNSHFLTRFF